MLRARYVRLLPLLVLPLCAQNAYVDSGICSSCHAKISETYAKTGMARSFFSPQPGKMVEDFTRGVPFDHRRSGTYYSMPQHDGGYYQKRWRVDASGQESDVQESRIDYVMGSGNHARTYLHRTSRGALIQLPLAWYPEGGGTWAMSPGYDRDYVLPPTAVSYECMACHNSYPGIPSGHEEPGSEPLYAGGMPQGIDCQRCHGPGTNHVRAAQSRDPKLASIRSSIVNPARLSPARQLDVCMQCHLETSSMPLPHSIRKYGRDPFSYRPGEALGDFMSFFEYAPGSPHRDDFEIVSSAYRLRKSQCFLQSNSKLTCTTCHDPHGRPQADSHFSDVCRSCHASALAKIPDHQTAGDCVPCHMPKRRTQDVVHVVMTDHLIARRPPPGDLLAALSERSLTREHQQTVPYLLGAASVRGDLYAAIAAKNPTGLAAEIARQRPARPEFYIELGQAWLSASKPENAIVPFEEAVQRKPASPVALLNLGDALTRANQYVRAISLLTRAVNLIPSDPLLWYQLGIAQSKAGNDPAAFSAFEKSSLLDPDMAGAHTLLGATLASEGDFERAARELRVALQISPDSPDAQSNMGHLLAARGNFTEANFYLARSIRLKPNDAEMRTNYAVVLAGLNQFEEAQRQADAAVRLDPKSPEAHNLRGSLLEHSARANEALAEFLQAVELQPDFALAHWNAATILSGQGNRSAATLHFRKAAASSDPNLRAKASAALRQITAH